MRRKDREITDKKIIHEILTESFICRLGLFDNNYPYVIPLNYGYRENSLYFHCALQGKKTDLIKQNNKVGFEIEQTYEITKSDISCKWTTKYRSVTGNGSIEIISDFEEKKKGLDIIMQHHGKNDNEYNDKLLENMLVLKLNINNISAKQAGISP